MAAAVAAGLLLVNRRLGLLAGLASLLMAFARVYIGAHYPGTFWVVWSSARPSLFWDGSLLVNR